MRKVRAVKCGVFVAVLLGLMILVSKPVLAQAEFETASIHLSKAPVKYERNGSTEWRRGTLQMTDVTVSTCIQWAYGVSMGLVSGPPELTDVHYDILAKMDPDATPEQTRVMMRALLAERFKLQFHREKKEMRVYSLTVAKGGIKMKPAAAPDGEASHQNDRTGTVAKSMTMKEWADYLSDPLGAPLTDDTGLQGRYDFTMDFTPYVDMVRTEGVRPDPAAVLKAALKGDLGLEMIQHKETVEVIVVDHVQAPSSN